MRAHQRAQGAASVVQTHFADQLQKLKKPIRLNQRPWQTINLSGTRVRAHLRMLHVQVIFFSFTFCSPILSGFQFWSFLSQKHWKKKKKKTINKNLLRYQPLLVLHRPHSRFSWFWWWTSGSLSRGSRWTGLAAGRVVVLLPPGTSHGRHSFCGKTVGEECLELKIQYCLSSQLVEQ